MNRVNLIGIVGNDLVRQKYCEFDSFVDVGLYVHDEGEKSDWFECVAKGETADAIAEDIKKGDIIYAKGRILISTCVDERSNPYFRQRVLITDYELIEAYDGKGPVPEMPSSLLGTMYREENTPGRVIITPYD